MSYKWWIALLLLPRLWSGSTSVMDQLPHVWPVTFSPGSEGWMFWPRRGSNELCCVKKDDFGDQACPDLLFRFLPSTESCSTEWLVEFSNNNELWLTICTTIGNSLLFIVDSTLTVSWLTKQLHRTDTKIAKFTTFASIDIILQWNTPCLSVNAVLCHKRDATEPMDCAEASPFHSSFY